ncbi:COG4705 family protein [Dictyobacter formicarum]
MHVLKKVPEITVYFWIIKLLTTAMGETTSDYMVNHIDPVIAVAIGGLGLLAALVLQLVVRRYVPSIYWLAVVMVAIFGTMAADVLHIGLGIPYLVSTVFFAAALAVIFGVWYASEKTLSIHSIYTLRRELFYWATIITTFALGTALGDMTASTLGLGYLSSGMLFAVLFALPALAYWLLGLNEILAFWFAYIVTRPLGASFADWMGKPKSAGGVGIGTGTVSLVLAILIVGFIVYLTISHKDSKGKQP